MARTRSSAGPVVTGSIRCGCSPARPSTTAGTVPWPCPVAPSEPKSSQWARAVSSSRPSSTSRDTNRKAARIGPTVCELDGPIPTVNRSSTDSVMGIPWE